MIPVLFLLSLFVFSMMHFLPGDPATLMLVESQATSVEAVERLREQLGLNDPLHVQYWRFVSRAVRGDFGRSVQSRRPVMDSIMEVFPQTLQLALAAILVSASMGLVLGSIAALKQNSLFDNASMLVALSGVSMPIFWVGLLLMLVFSVKLGWIPVTGQGGVKRLILPAIALGWGAAGVIARLTRASLLEVLRQDHVMVARAKGLRERSVVVTHGLRNALIPVITIVGLQFGGLLGGAVIAETVFARQGVGRLAVNAVLVKDFPVVQGSVFIIAIAYMFVNLFVDVVIAWLDPRIKYSAETAR
jgi:peptide/nickel transport system permease protein